MTSASDVAFTYICGLTTTMVSAPLIHPFNVVAAGAARTQHKSYKAALDVHHGLGGNRPNSALNFWNGLAGHCSKELVRSFGRVGGVVYVEKDFKERFSPALAPTMLALVMASYEVAFANPADVWKSFRSTGLQTTMPDLFKGSLGNGCRQFGMWYVWSLSTPFINTFLDSDASGKIGAGTTSGIAVRSFMQAVACTTATYPFELVLRTVQVRSAEYPVKNFSATAKFFGQCLANPGLIATDSAYVRVTADLIRKNGVRGLGLGMTSKLLGNWMLLSNANFLPMFTTYMKKKTRRDQPAAAAVEKK